MTPLDIGEWVRQTMGGSLVVALPVAALAGLVSFFSPCVVPLVPGYLSYATGIGAADIVDGKASTRRMLLGTSLFVLGIAVVFVTTGAAFGGLGATLLVHQRLVSVIAGVLAILMGLAFSGLLPIFTRDVRTNWAPRAGLAAAPVLGLAFALASLRPAGRRLCTVRRCTRVGTDAPARRDASRRHPHGARRSCPRHRLVGRVDGRASTMGLRI